MTTERTCAEEGCDLLIPAGPPRLYCHACWAKPRRKRASKLTIPKPPPAHLDATSRRAMGSDSGRWK